MNQTFNDKTCISLITAKEYDDKSKALLDVKRKIRSQYSTGSE